MQELRDKADFYTKTGMILVWDCELAVVKSDTIVPDALLNSLRTHVRPLEDIPAHAKDWHPGSDKKVLDLLHPSLFPLISETSRALRTGTVPLENCAQYIGTGDPIDVLEGPAGYLFSRQIDWAMDNAWGSFQWLPSNVSFTESGEPRIDSYINNLHPAAHRELYKTLEKFVGHAIPLWNESLSWFENRTRLDCPELHSNNDFFIPNDILFEPTESDAEDAGSDFDRDSDDTLAKEPKDRLRPLTYEQAIGKGLQYCDRFEDWYYTHRVLKKIEPREFWSRADWESQPEHRPVDLQADFWDSGLQIIFKLANIHLTPEKPDYEGGTWHIEGALNEHICATALFYYDEENITESSLAFRQQFDTEQLGFPPQYEFHSIEHYYNIENQDEAIQDLGSVVTRQGRLLAFPNILQHKVEPFRLEDPHKPGHRKILAMFLVDPHIRILSTANVPPQRRDWWAVEVAKIHPFNRLPREVFEMIIDAVEGFPISWERAVEVRKKLMDERRNLTSQFNSGMNMVSTCIILHLSSFIWVCGLIECRLHSASVSIEDDTYRLEVFKYTRS